MAHLFVSGMASEKWFAYYLRCEFDNIGDYGVRVTFGTDPLSPDTHLMRSVGADEPFSAVIMILSRDYLESGWFDTVTAACHTFQIPLIPVAHAPFDHLILMLNLRPIFFADYHYESALYRLFATLVAAGVELGPLPERAVYSYDRTKTPTSVEPTTDMPPLPQAIILALLVIAFLILFASQLEEVRINADGTPLSLPPATYYTRQPYATRAPKLIAPLEFERSSFTQDSPMPAAPPKSKPQGVNLPVY